MMAYFNKLGTVAWAKEIMAMVGRLELEGAVLNMRETIERREAMRILNTH
jgi:hypothetical protein